jgi:hypothetical protein
MKLVSIKKNRLKICIYIENNHRNKLKDKKKIKKNKKMTKINFKIE